MYNYGKAVNKEEYSLEEFEASIGKKLSEEQKNILKSKNNSCIIACAGSGKTETIANLVSYKIFNNEIREPEKVCVTTFSNSGVSEIENRLKGKYSILNIGGTSKVCTMHSLFYEILRVFGLSSRLTNDREKTEVIRNIITYEAFSQKFGKTPFLRNEEIVEIINFFGYCINCNKTIESVLHDEGYYFSFEIDNPDILRYIYNELNKYKNERNCIDFDDMQAILYNWLVKFKDSSDEKLVKHRENVLAYIRNKFDWFIVDEAQDTSALQQAILYEILGSNDKRAYFVGDDDQTIYEWRGSKPEFMFEVMGDLKLDYYTLSTSYRCRENILRYSESLISKNSNRFKKNLIAFKEGGSVEINSYNDIWDTSLRIANDIFNENRCGRGNDIAVLVRNNSDADIIKCLLAINGIFCRTSNNKVITSRIFFEAKNIALDSYGIRNVKDLQKYISYMSNKQCEYIKDTMNKEGLTLFECIDKHGSKTLKAEQLNEINYIKSIINSNEDCRSKFKKLYGAYTSKIGNRDLEMYTAYYKLFEYAFDTIKGEVNFVVDSLEKIQGIDCNAICSNKSSYIGTVHSVKGLEYRKVYVCDVYFNQFKEALKNLNNERQKNKYIEEERRIWYVACTRAIDNLSINFMKGKSFYFEMETN